MSLKGDQPRRRLRAICVIALDGLLLSILAFAGYVGRAAGAGPRFWAVWVPLVLAVSAYLVWDRRRPSSEFVLNSDGLPISGRDADRYAAYRARLCPHERQALDEFLAAHRTDEK